MKVARIQQDRVLDCLIGIGRTDRAGRTAAALLAGTVTFHSELHINKALSIRVVL